MGYRNGIVLQVVIISAYLGFNSKYMLPSLAIFKCVVNTWSKGYVWFPKTIAFPKLCGIYPYHLKDDLCFLLAPAESA